MPPRPRPFVRLLLLELQAIERGIAAALGEQFVVAARLDHFAGLDHQDAVGVHDGRKPVRDHDGGAALAQFRDRLLHVIFGFGIERGGGLVEQDDRRIFDQRARDRDALTLAARNLEAVLADLGIIACGKAHDEIMRMRGLGRGDDFRLGGARLAECDVLTHGGTEQEDVLAHGRDLLPQRTA